MKRFLKILLPDLMAGTFAAPIVGMGATSAITGDGIGTMAVSPTAAPAGSMGNACLHFYDRKPQSSLQPMRLIWLSKDSRSRSRGGVVRSNTAQLARSRHYSNEGFTVLEALIVMVIVLVVIGGVFLSRGSVTSLNSSVTDRLGALAASEFVAASFPDVQSATEFTTMATPSGPVPCGTSSQLLGLLWRSSPSTNTIVSYAVIPNGAMKAAKTASVGNLVRYECTSVDGASPSLTKTTVLSYNVPTDLVVRLAGQSCSTTTCSSASSSGTVGWASASGLTNIVLVVREAAMSSSHLASTSGGTP